MTDPVMVTCGKCQLEMPNEDHREHMQRGTCATAEPGDVLKDLGALRRFAETETDRLAKVADEAVARSRKAIDDGEDQDVDDSVPTWTRALAEVHRDYARRIRRIASREQERDVARSASSERIS